MMLSNSEAGAGDPSEDTLTELYNRRQPYVVGLLFMVLGVALALGIGTSATASPQQTPYFLGLLAVAVAFAVGGYMLRGPRRADRSSRGSRTSLVAASGGTVFLLSVSDMVVAMAAALAVPYFAWASGRVWRDTARLTRAIAEEGRAVRPHSSGS